MGVFHAKAQQVYQIKATGYIAIGVPSGYRNIGQAGFFPMGVYRALMDRQASCFFRI